MKVISYWWSLWVGVASPLAQIGIFVARFGKIPTDTSPLDYLLFFLAGVAGGYILVLSLNRAQSMKARWVVAIAFLLATPLALILMVAGGLFFSVFVLILPLIPWALFSWAGLAIGNRLMKS